MADWHGITVEETYTFEAQWGGSETWITSAGRWDEQSAAARAAAGWLQAAADRGVYPSVRIVSVTELATLEALSEDEV